jgi:hypothetical protein
MGRTECPDLNGLRASLGLEKATPSKRAKWRSSLSAYSSALKKCLTRADIVREACFRHLWEGRESRRPRRCRLWALRMGGCCGFCGNGFAGEGRFDFAQGWSARHGGRGSERRSPIRMEIVEGGPEILSPFGRGRANWNGLRETRYGRVSSLRGKIPALSRCVLGAPELPSGDTIEEEKYMDQPGAAPAAGVILDAAGNLYGTTVGGRQHDVWVGV